MGTDKSKLYHWLDLLRAGKTGGLFCELIAAAEMEAQTYEDETGLYELDIPRLWEITRSNPVQSVLVEPLCQRLGIEAAPASVSMEYPIILDSVGDLVDGSHRLARARWMGATKINAVFATVEQIKMAATRIGGGA